MQSRRKDTRLQERSGPRSPRLPTTRPHLTIATLVALSAVPAASGQGFDLDSLGQTSFGDSRDVVSVAFEPTTTEAVRGGTVSVEVVFQMKDGWHIWPQEGGAPQGSTVFDGAEWTAIDVVEAEGLGGSSQESLTLVSAALIRGRTARGAKSTARPQTTAVALGQTFGPLITPSLRASGFRTRGSPASCR